jgi:nanoRNase/pAp phosphatase (c-di-AMP/oligoRNAs hydrolase)
VLWLCVVCLAPSLLQNDQPNNETEIKVSLRSVDGFDTSAVTGAFGGGGHAAASSCIIGRDELRSWQDMSG